MFYAPSSFAQDANWIGIQSNNWASPQNWSAGTVPAPYSTININTQSPVGAVADGIQFIGTNLNVGTLVDSVGSLYLENGADFHFGQVSVGTSGTGTLSISDSILVSTKGVAIGSSKSGKVIISGETARLSILGSNTHLNIGNQSNGDGHLRY